MTFYKSTPIQSALKNPQYAYSTILSKIKNITMLDFRFLNGYSFLPDTIRIDLTYNCNLRCKLCFEFGKSAEELSSIPRNEEMDFGQLKHFLLDVKSFYPTIYLSGGEPLLYSHILDLLNFLQQNKLYTLVNTNGVLLEGFADQLVESGVDKLVISIDGPEEIHDKNRGKTFRKIVKGIEKLNAKKKDEKKPFPLIRINCLITPFNFKVLEEVVNIASQLEVESLSFQHPMFATDERKNEKSSEGSIDILGYVYEGEINPDILLQQMDKIAGIRVPFKKYFYPSVPREHIREYYNDINYPFKKACLTPWRKLMLTPSGDIGPCVHYPIANLSGKSFNEIWNSDDYRKFRNSIRKAGLFKNCVRCCLREY